MTKRIHLEYSKQETAEVAKFTESLKETAAPGGTFDSVAAQDFISSASNQKTSVKVPEKLQIVLDECNKEDKARVTRALYDGIGIYEAEHGVTAPADLVEQAIHCAFATSAHARRQYSLDSANSFHHDAISLQPNRAVVAILSIMGDAIPFAHYLPADIGSNEAILAIMSHNAGDTFGNYAANDIMDGGYSGRSYLSSSRVHTANPNGAGTVTGLKLTKVQTDSDTCDQEAPAVALLRGRSIVYVNGVEAAREAPHSSGTGNSPLSGSVTIDTTSYAISGTINTDTGEFTVNSTPALPTTVPVTVEGFIDFERTPELRPTILSAVNTYSIYAKPWTCKTRLTMDARTQMSNELGLDPYGESVVAIQAQFANERHYDVLAKIRRLAANNQLDYDFEWQTRKTDNVRATLWQDFSTALGYVSQKMAFDTMNHGVTHLYVGKDIGSQFLGLPSTLFEPSGIPERPAVYRLGRLFGKYEVYYTPREVMETENSGQVLCVGRATDVTRNPIVLGDAVPPTVLPLAVGDDLKMGAGFYARNFTSVNPHGPSSLGAAIINVTNLR
jgi:hypothetical protein